MEHTPSVRRRHGPQLLSVEDRGRTLDRGQVAGEFMTADITLDALMEKMYRVAETGSFD